VDYSPIGGSSWLPLPKEIALKKACVNVQNNDQKCFMWSILASLHQDIHVTNRFRVHQYTRYENELNFTGIEFPVKITDVTKFERNNNISIHVFGYKKGDILPLRISETHIPDRHVNLLYFSKDSVGHYVTIINLSRLISSQISRHRGRAGHICVYCLHKCSSIEVYEKHVSVCRLHGAQAVRLPTREKGDDKIKFSKTEHQLRLPFAIYADFECILPKLERGGEESRTVKTQEHKPCGFALYVVSTDRKFYREPFVYFGEDAAVKFIDKTLEVVTELRQILKRKLKMKPLTLEEQNQYKYARNCYICKEQLPRGWTDDKTQIKVRDHDHLTRLYRGPAHSICNLQLRIDPKRVRIPVILHNLKGYDSHIIISAIEQHHGNVSCIPSNSEKYISFNIEDVVFIDSLQFMCSSLDRLAKNPEHVKFTQVRRFLESKYTVANEDLYTVSFQDEDINDGEEELELLGDYRNQPYVEPRLTVEERNEVEDHFKLLVKKGVYPYEYMDSMERFLERRLPSKENFYSSLTMENITDEEYTHAKTIWESFEVN